MDGAYRCASSGFTFVISCTWTAVVVVVVIDICIVYNCCLVVNIWTVSVVISVHIAVVHISVGEECPIAGWCVDVDID